MSVPIPYMVVILVSVPVRPFRRVLIDLYILSHPVSGRLIMAI